MKKINLIMPMGGLGSRFLESGIRIPKPLIQLNDKPFFYWATSSIVNYVNIEKLVFVVLQKHCNDYNIDKVILTYFPKASIIKIQNVLNGALLTGLRGLDIINNDMPIVFNDCDHMFICKSFYNYCNSCDNNLDGAILTFKSNSPKYSYIAKNSLNNVLYTVEKKVVSDEAICGAYYFKNKYIILKNYKKYINNCKYNEYYFSGLYNELIKNNAIIRNFDVDMHISFGTPEELESAQKMMSKNCVTFDS